MSGERRTYAARAVCEKLRQVEWWADARSLLVFLTFGSEISTREIIDEAMRCGKSVYVPAVGGDLLEFRRIVSADQPLGTGVLGIREPGKDSPVWSFSGSAGPALVLVPGLAFDTSGGRLGRGRGYYDRFIGSVRRGAGAAGERPPLFVGLGFREQVLTDLPMEGHDERLDGLVTDNFAVLFHAL
jgi:5-formyltetrahydrofolate cyclo-ligase